MTFEKIRYAWKFGAYTFPEFRYQYEPQQSLVAPTAPSIGESYAIDLLDGAPGLQDVGRETVRFALYGHPESLNPSLDSLKLSLYSLGVDKLWTKTDDPYEPPRWCWARLAEMPGITVSGLVYHEIPVILRFTRLSTWFSEALLQPTQLANSNGQQWTVNNPGPLPVTQLILLLRPQVSAGINAPRIINLTNGYRFETSRVSSSTNHRVRLNTNYGVGPNVEFSSNSGSSWSNDISNYVFPLISQPLLSFRLEPGNNTIRIEGTSPNVHVSFHFNEAWL